MNITLSTALYSLLSLAALNDQTDITKPCPLLGPVFPPPQILSTDPTILAAGDQLASTFESLKRQNATMTGYGSLDFKGTSFSVQLFSLHEQDPFRQFHYTAPAVANSTIGTKTVDQNTIYRIGSATKLLTVWMFLIEAGDIALHNPVTKYVPELLDIDSQRCGNSSSSSTDAICIMWSDVTIQDLASHMAGIQKERKMPQPACTKSAHLSNSDVQGSQRSRRFTRTSRLSLSQRVGYTQLFRQFDIDSMR